MASIPNKEICIPETLEFLELVWKQEDECEIDTDKLILNLGKRVSACLVNMGTVLSLLDRMASCWWACHGGDHVIEYLCGRVASNARAALRMLRFGFYDECLLVSRSIGEIANLLYLFAIDEASLNDWKAASRQERMRTFRPVNVRQRIEKLSSPPISEDQYRLLSECAAHVHPQTRPQSHNILGVPSAGASVQQEGVVVCVNELGLALSPVVVSASLILPLDIDIKERVFSECESLIENIGSITITEVDRYRRLVLASPRARDQFKRIAKTLRHHQDRKRNK